MSLIKCRECEKEISSDVGACPNCGAKIRKRMSCIMVAGLIMAIIIFLAMAKACAGGSGGNDSTGVEKGTDRKSAGQQEEKNNTSAISKPASERERLKIGDEVQVGKMIYRVNETAFRKTVGNDFINETADGIYLLISVSMKNVSKKSLTIDNSLFKLKDKNGVEYEFSTKASTALQMSGNETLFLKQCQPNIVTSGILVFEVPKEDEYFLNLSDGVWSVNSAEVVLEN